MAFPVPPEAAHFVAREAEQERARRAVAQWRGRSRPICLTLTGLGGAGKTELAYRLARELRERCPDGTLYLDLDDLRRDGAVEVADALGDLLRQLHVDAAWLERSYQELRRQYWERTDGKQLTVILDNARYGSEVRELFPSSGASVVIVASHGPLYDLDDGLAVALPVDPLDDPPARELLRLVANDPRLTAEPEPVTGLLRLCSGLPAALRIAGAWVRRHPHRSLARLVRELGAELEERGLPMVERIWDTYYRELGADAAALYRLLSGFPGHTFTPDAAAALLGRGPEAAEDALDELLTAGLLDSRGTRLRFPELLRAHARRRARQDGGEAAGGRGAGGESEAGEARRRLVRWYLRQAQRADLLAAGPRLKLAEQVPELPGAPDVPLADGAAAYGWLEAERHVLYGLVRLAYASGLDTETWSLCEPLWTHYLDHPHYADVIDAFRTGVSAAQRAEDVPVLVRMRCQLARPLWEQGLLEEAGAELEQAAGALPLLGGSRQERKLAASAVEFRGMLRSVQGDWGAAAADFETSREVHRALENGYGVMLQTYRLGEAVAALGAPDRAEALLREAHDRARSEQRVRMTGRTGFALGGVLRRLGRQGEARELYAAALTAARERGAPYDEVRVLDACAELAEEDGRPEEAREHREAARIIRARHGGLARE